MHDAFAENESGSQLKELARLALLADEGYSGAHPRDSNNWRANEAFCRAATPSTILKLVAVVEKARELDAKLARLFDGSSDKAFAGWQNGHGEDVGSGIDSSLSALRSALAALDDREPA